MYYFYKKLLEIPFLGTLVKGLRNLYHHPRLEAIRLSRSDRRAAHACIDKFFGLDSPAHKHLDEFVSSSYFGGQYSFGHSGDFAVMILYIFTRMTKPEIAIETGVASGRSSATTLYAMSLNEKGKLYSIDLPQTISGNEPVLIKNSDGHSELSGFLDAGKAPGWLIPDNLRGRWELILGDSNIEIPKLLSRVSQVDLFYHDGDHTYESMSFEYRVMWGRMESGGVLISDDTRWSLAWTEFVAANPDKKSFMYRGFGIIQK